MKRLYCLFLDRENPKRRTEDILQAIDYVNTVFPSASSRKAPGIKGKNYLLLPFHNGSFKIAEKDRLSDHTDES